jgi:tripartite-type tricarboxylate transporter receptor subunit TctC
MLLIIRAMPRGLIAKARLAAVGGMFVAAIGAQAQDYPSRSVKVVVPWPAGAITDATARKILETVSRDAGQAFIVENKVGASGAIGSYAVSKAPADGYTLLVSSSDTHAINPVYYARLNYGTRDFAEITGLAKFSYTLAIGAHVPANTLAEFVALAKANPRRYTYATWGNGSLAHLGSEAFGATAGVQLMHVPFQGAAPGLQALLAGTVDMMILPVAAAEQNRKTGKLKVLALAGPSRARVLPDVPTTAELGYADVVVQQWFGLVAPRGTAPEVQKKLGDWFSKAATQPDMVAWLETQGGEPMVLPADRLRSFQASESVRWGRVIRESKIDIQP